MTEHWRPIPNWEGLYSVSDRGRVRSEPRDVYRATTARGSASTGDAMIPDLLTSWPAFTIGDGVVAGQVNRPPRPRKRRKPGAA